MIIKISYDSSCIPFKEDLESNLNGIIFYNEEYYKDKKDSYKLKSSCGARLNPFCAIYNDNKNLVKAFYSEVGECTVTNILNYLNTNGK